MNETKDDAVGREPGAEDRRRALKAVGRFVAVSAPAVTLLLAAGAKPTNAQTVSTKGPPTGPPVSSRQFKIAVGHVDKAGALAAVSLLGAGMANTDQIDGVGLCLAAIKGLVERVELLQREGFAL